MFETAETLTRAQRCQGRRPRSLPVAARRAGQLAAVRPAGRDRGRHRFGQDRRRHRRHRRRAAPRPLRARGRAVTRADGAVARPPGRRRCPAPGSVGWATAARTARPTATCSSPPVTRPPRQAGPAGRRAGCSSPTSATASAARTLRRAMLPQYDERLGLTATLERTDDAVTELLHPVLRRHLLPLRVRAGHRRRRVRRAPRGVRRRRRCRSRSGPSTPRPSSSS